LVLGRYSFSISEDYKFENLFLQNLPDRSEFICRAIKKFISDNNNLSPMELFIKKQIEKWECTTVLLQIIHSLMSTRHDDVFNLTSWL